MRNIPLIVVFVCLAFICPFLYADTIMIQADSWCPYNCDPNTASPGYMIEVAETVFKKKGHAIKYSQNLWSRALYRVNRGNLDAVVGVSKREAPQLIYPEESLGFSVTVFFTRRDSSWEYQGVKSLGTVKVGIQKDYDYGEKLQAYFQQYQKSDKVQVALDGLALFPLQVNMEKLMKGEIDAVPEDKNVFLYTAKEMGCLDKVRYAGSEKDMTPESNNVYIAFSPVNKKSQEYADILTQGIRELRAIGELKRILEKYGLSDWK